MEKHLATYKPSDLSPYSFVHSNLEKNKLPPYAGDIWVPALPINRNRLVKIFVPNMEKLFKPRNKIVKVEHVRVTSKLLSWILEVDQAGIRKRIIESKDHVDFCDYF